MLQVLPYLEQQSLYDQWDFTQNVFGNAQVAQTDICVFYCPTRRNGIRSEDRRILAGRTSLDVAEETITAAASASGNGWTNDYDRYFSQAESGNESEHWQYPQLAWESSCPTCRRISPTSATAQAIRS